MRKSILIKIIGITGMVFLLANLVLMMICGNAIYTKVREVYASYAVNASTVGSQFMDAGVYAEPTLQMPQFIPEEDNRQDFRKAYTVLLKDICDSGQVQYVYVFRPDTKNQTVTYLALAANDEANPGVIKDLTEGTVRRRSLTPAEQEAYEGKTNCLEETNNEYGHVISCFNPIYNSDTRQVEAVIGADVSLSQVETEFNHIFINYIILMASFLLTVMLLLYVILKIRLLKPARVISEKMMAFTETHDAANSKVPVRGKDEFARMALAFNTMTDEIGQYIQDIEQLNREKHRRETEMKIAFDIQNGLLPPGQTLYQAVTFRASMRPARNVGGDFYDYDLLPDGRYYICIADVSGKGVSAALFMARTITVIRQFARMGYSPREILEGSNKSVCDYNANRMFVTVFVGIYDPKTGILTYSNAGHYLPYVLSDRMLVPEPVGGTAIGVFKRVNYQNGEIRLKPGDTVFLYTDGVNEAVSGKDEFFGDERMEQVLSSLKDERREKCVEAMQEALKEFVGDELQSDDVTMLSMTLCTRYEEKLMPEKKNLKKLHEIILMDPYIPKALHKKLCLVAEEVFAAFCSGEPGDEEKPITFRMEVGNKVMMTFLDSGKPFDPIKEADEEKDNDHSAGRVGIYLTKAIAESCRYEYTDHQNVLQVIVSYGE